MKKFILIAFLLLCEFATNAQEKITIQSSDYTNQAVEMADLMRSEGKIYVVVTVVMTIFGGIVAYLIRLDLRTRKLENLLKEKKDVHRHH
ncbi:MAG: CcmD family protein [Flammeovirgaceae bacterium]|nr:CcmD family protein [Flammeovirgaceae bacterium]MDW8287194.1 CcmD family protein [Flammeovirgaceae bacterium]